MPPLQQIMHIGRTAAAMLLGEGAHGDISNITFPQWLRDFHIEDNGYYLNSVLTGGFSGIVDAWRVNQRAGHFYCDNNSLTGSLNSFFASLSPTTAMPVTMQILSFNNMPGITATNFDTISIPDDAGPRSRLR